MKKTLIIALAMLMMLSAFAACTKTAKSNTPASEADLPKTLGDIFAIESVNIAGYQSSGKAVVIVYQVDGSYWRAIAPMTEEQSEAWFAVDVFDENKEEEERAILSPLEIVQLDNLDKEKLSDEDLKAFVGKTGEELMNAGWASEGGDPTVPESYMSYGPFLYTVVFESGAEYVESDDFELETFIRPLKVKSITYSGLAYTATDLPEEYLG